eukprot:gene11094-18709_t
MEAFENRSKAVWKSLDADSRVEVFWPDPSTKAYRLAEKKPASSQNPSLDEVIEIAVAYLATQEGQVASSPDLGMYLHKHYEHLLTAMGHTSANKKVWKALAADPRVQMFLIEPDCIEYRLVKGMSDKQPAESKASKPESDKPDEPKSKDPKPKEPKSSEAVLEYKMPMLQAPSTSRELKPLPPGGLVAQVPSADAETGSDFDAIEVMEVAVAYLAKQEGQVASSSTLVGYLHRYYEYLLDASGNRISNKRVWKALAADPRVEVLVVKDVYLAFWLVKNNFDNKSDRGMLGKDSEETKVSKDKVFEKHEESEESGDKEYESSQPVLECNTTMPQTLSTSQELKPSPPGTLAAQDPSADADAGSDSDAMDNAVENIVSVMPIRFVAQDPSADSDASSDYDATELTDIVVAYIAAQEGQVASSSDVGIYLHTYYEHLLTAMGHTSSNKRYRKALQADPRFKVLMPKQGCVEYRYKLVKRMSDSNTPDKGTSDKLSGESKASKEFALEKSGDSEESDEPDESDESDKPYEPKESKEPKPKEPMSSEAVLEYEMTMLQALSTSRELKPLPPGSLAAQDAPADAAAGSDSDAMDDDVESLLSVMPARLQKVIRLHSHGPNPLMEVAVDDGRDVVLRFVDGSRLVLNGVQVPISEAMACLMKARDGSSKQEKETGFWDVWNAEFWFGPQRGESREAPQEEPFQASANQPMDRTRANPFSSDGRMGVAGTLHRISGIRNRDGKVYGLTYRISRHMPGIADIFMDILSSMCDKDSTQMSLLVLGPPGAGKTTLLRDISRQLADVCGKSVIVIDTSNEIGGEGERPHPCIGGARRFMVPQRLQQHATMIEAVQNHTPQVLIVDEIGTAKEVAAVNDIAQRGVLMVGTDHGTTLTSLLKNKTLAPLVGGIRQVTIGDGAAEGGSKTKLERSGPPAFTALVEVLGNNRWRVHLDLAESVDLLLKGLTPGAVSSQAVPAHTELRRYSQDQKMVVSFETKLAAKRAAPGSIA